MNKKLILAGSLFTVAIGCLAAAKIISSHWRILPKSMLTQWGEKIDIKNPWPQYPRPDMARNRWQNLNGIWQYAITPKDVRPKSWQGQILVPFSVESALSGVRKKLTSNQTLWYKRTFTLPDNWNQDHILLNFEASDWETKVWIDGQYVDVHQGGYDPFSLDITFFLNNKDTHEIIVSVSDPTDTNYQPRGKQNLNPQDIWFTASSGIWQTVWLEPVSYNHISSFKTISDINTGALSFNVTVSEKLAKNEYLEVVVSSDNKIITSAKGQADSNIKLKVPHPTLWSPDNPFLYDVIITLKKDNTVVDQIQSYVGFRQISIGKTSNNLTKILFNNNFVYQKGILDQGYWPDGLYTPPSEEAMLYDLEMVKKLGFNMLRKHVKFENRRFYYWCDKMGILVWQDMPNAGINFNDEKGYKISTDQFKLELKNLINTQYNHPSIIVWIPFNEDWEQFEIKNINNFIQQLDSTRLIDSVSGGTSPENKINDYHFYPGQTELSPTYQPPLLNEINKKDNRPFVVGETGGIKHYVDDHVWPGSNKKGQIYNDVFQLEPAIQSYDTVFQSFLTTSNLSATIFTQLTDVETEINGLLTYDRKIVKLKSFR